MPQRFAPLVRLGLPLALAAAAAARSGAPALACSGAPDAPKPAGAGEAVAPAPLAEALGLALVAHLDIPQGAAEATSDLWKLGDTLVTGYRCGGDGSAIIDVAEPSAPRILARTVAMPGSFANDVKAIRLDLPAFKGDLFIEPHDTCAGAGSTVSARTRFWDLGDPARPLLLGSLDTVNGVHNVYPFVRDGRAYLLMALPAGDTAKAGLRAGFAIADISDPRAPRVVGQYNLRADLGDLPGTDFLHDVWASPDGRTAYLSWWDAGLVVADIADLTRPRRVARLAYVEQPEWYGRASGNTHSTVPLADGRHVVITDEDFSVGDFSFEVSSPAAERRVLETSLDDFLRPILGGGHAGTVVGVLKLMAEPCAQRPGELRERVALAERSPRCTAAQQVEVAQEAGALALVLVNPDNTGEGRLEGWLPGLRIPAVQVSRASGARLKSAVKAHPEVQVRLEAKADAWGFTRIADLAAPGGPRLVARVTTENTDRFPPPDNGWHSVHNPMVVGDTLYLSHYADGVRVWDVSDPTAPFETAHFVPPDLTDGRGRTLQSQIWGVYPEGDLVYASDIAHGLWILARDPVIGVPSPPPSPSEDPTVAPTPRPTATATATVTAIPTALPSPVVFTPAATATPTLEPTPSSAPSATASATATPRPTVGRPDRARLVLPWLGKPRRRG